nr:hypothetical protein [Paracoccus yeei]
MASQGVIYPENDFVAGAKEGKITSGNGVELANYIRPELPHKIADKSVFLEKFDRLLKNSDGEDFLFSSEFIVFQDNPRTGSLIDCIERNGYDAKSIYLVRDLSKAAFSAYSQQVKRAGEAKTFGEFLKSWDPYYLHHINLMNQAFGFDNVFLYNYEEHKHRLAALLFNDFMKININANTREVINRSLDQKELELLRVFNSFSGKNNVFASTLISDALMNTPSSSTESFLISPEEFSILNERFTRSIEKINQQLRGRGIVIAQEVGTVERNFSLTEFERFTMVALAQISRAIAR